MTNGPASSLLLDLISWGGLPVLFVSVSGFLPPAVAFIATTLGLIWYAIQIWESRTVKRWRRSLGWNVPVEDDEI